MKSNTIIILVVTVIIAAGVYWYFFAGTGNQPPLSATDTSTNQAQTQFQTLVSELQPISFDTSIFSDAHFNALADLTTPISPEGTGRLDPFAAVSSSNSISASSSSPGVAKTK